MTDLERKGIIDQLTRERLWGDPELSALLAGNTREALERRANGIAGYFGRMRQEREAAQIHARERAEEREMRLRMSGLSPGEAKFAAAMTVPKPLLAVDAQPKSLNSSSPPPDRGQASRRPA
jgi:hypothetical protein